ncbi:MAG: aminotransferase class V-fold PLP-dependent enzyme [Alphaproteobacteria bacterium]|nr:aminotransferase class V-fold PLP-dependent enzyme [Alphaproteobacteria bacterium]
MSTQNPVFIPGPTNIPERLRHAMNVPTMDHRAPNFVKVLEPLLADLKKIFKTKSGTVITFPSSGTGGWEAALTNTLSPGDKVLVSRFGMFSQRWIEMCERLGLEVDVIECAWGDGAPAAEYGKRLAADTYHKIKAVLVTHNETATGVTSDIAAVRKEMDAAEHPALLYVDAVSSLGSMDFRMDEWGVDLAVSGSQKGFMLATGMAILGVSPKAFIAAETAECPRCFFDIRDMAGANAKGNFPYTPPLPLLMGLRESVNMLLEEGLDQVFARHHRLAEGVRRAVDAWGLRLCANKPEWYSDSVSAIYVPDGFDSNELVNHAFEAYGVSFGVGLGKVAGKAFRIGHLGMLTDTLVLSGLATIEMAMKDLGYPITLGSGVAAAQEYYRHDKHIALKKAS